jgi:hypothetical protein
MVYWEFILQKEGDRFWLPLNTRTIEIEEGKYRILARGDRVNQDVEIRLTHQDFEEDKFIDCFLKRYRRINSEGLIALIPFTYLVPGLWELSCCGGDIMSDLLGESWKERLRVQVFPIVEKYSTDWDEPSYWEEYPSYHRSNELEENFVKAKSNQLSNYSLIHETPPQPSPVQTQNEILATLTGQHFNISSDSEELLEVVQYSEKDWNPLSESSFAEEQESTSVYLDLPEPKKMKKVLNQQQNSSCGILPPKISRVSNKTVKSPQLPKLVEKAPAKITSVSQTGISQGPGIIKGKFSTIDEAFQALKLQNPDRT